MRRGTGSPHDFKASIIGVRPLVVWQLGALSRSRNVGEDVDNDAMHFVSDDANRASRPPQD